jgi:cell division transport system permease protein
LYFIADISVSIYKDVKSCEHSLVFVKNKHFESQRLSCAIMESDWSELMLLFIKCLPRLFGQAGKDIRRHGTLTFSAVLSIAIALLISMVLIILAANISNFTEKIDERISVQVSLLPTVDEVERPQIEKELTSMKDVDSVTFSDKESQLDQLILEDGDTFEQYKGEGKNPLYDVFIVELKDNTKIDEFVEKASKISGVAQATYGTDAVSKLIHIFESFRKGGSIIVSGMAVLAIFLIYNTIRLTIQVRRDEISIMRTVGAYNWYISFPLVLEGLVIGFLGAIIPIVLCAVAYTYLYKAMNGMFISEMFLMVKPWPFVYKTGLELLLLGAGVGTLGSAIATGIYLRGTR